MWCMTELLFVSAVNDTLRAIGSYVTSYECSSSQGLVCLLVYTAERTSGVGITQRLAMMPA